MIRTVDIDGEGTISKEEFLELIWTEMEQNKPAEPFVELFKNFGAADYTDVITIGKFAEALKSEGE